MQAYIEEKSDWTIWRRNLQENLQCNVNAAEWGKLNFDIKAEYQIVLEWDQIEPGYSDIVSSTE